MSTGRKFAAVFPHADDFTIFAWGVMHHLVERGSSGVWVRVTDDCKDSVDVSPGRTANANEAEAKEAAASLGITTVIDMDYKNHGLDFSMLPDLTHRLMSIFRSMRIDSVVTFDPWAPYEENPDHLVTARATESACWMASRLLSVPEHSQLGLLPVSVVERFYVARDCRLANSAAPLAGLEQQKASAIERTRTQMEFTVARENAARHAEGLDPVSMDAYIHSRLVGHTCSACGAERVEEPVHYVNESLDRKEPWNE